MVRENSTISLIIIDDHPIFRQGVGDILTLEKDFEVKAYASDGLEGLKVIRQIQPRVAIVDENLPGMDGLELAKEVTSEKIKTKLIILTADTRPELILSAMQVGVCAYCTKDIPPEELIEIIYGVVEGYYFVEGQKMTDLELQNWLQLQKEGNIIVEDGIDKYFKQLSLREKQVLAYLAEGRTNKEIAQTLGISHQTVKNHVTSLMRKMGVGDRTQAALFALNHNWIQIDRTLDEE